MSALPNYRFSEADAQDFPILNAANAFGGMERSEANFGGKLGYGTTKGLSADELAHVKSILHRKVAANAAAIDPEHGKLVESTSVEQYHTIADRIEHARMFSKAGRILSDADVKAIRETSLFDTVRDIFGDYTLSDEEGVGWEQISFRFVRPNVQQDVGFLHKDDWFWQHNNWPVPAGKKRAKCWVGLVVDAGRNGLGLVPESHNGTFDFDAEMMGNKLAFKPRFNPDDLDIVRFPGPAGQPVFFNYHTLHVGSVNKGNLTRVSMEFTILFK
jgi:hypothetical protein